MDLENRLLKNYYPRSLNGQYYLTRNHGVKTLGFDIVKNNYEYRIESPSVKLYNERRLLLNIKGNNNGNEPFENYSGLIGESLMRIILKEFFRRLEEQYPSSEFTFIKSDLNPLNDNKTILENDKYILEGVTRYNQRIIDKNCKKLRTVSEFDGLLQYEIGRKTKGIVVCESKIGDIGYLKNPENNLDEIYNKIINPIKSLFYDKEIDFLLMGTRDKIFQRKKK